MSVSQAAQDLFYHQWRSFLEASKEDRYEPTKMALAIAIRVFTENPELNWIYRVASYSSLSAVSLDPTEKATAIFNKMQQLIENPKR